MNYTQTVNYLFERLPMYQRIGGAAYKADLKQTHQLCEILDHPEHKFRSVHVAGTNGKGSTSNLLASIMQEAGLKTGLYTSPHYTDFRERIKINGQMIPQDEVVSFVQKWKKELEAINLSFFEMTVGMAFQYFAQQKVDIAIIEVGMGGRLDSTNVINPMASVITNIGLDHMQFLGSTLPEIAAEKAGIIKSSVPLIVGETQNEISSLFEETAAKKNAPITFADQHWKIDLDASDKSQTPTIKIYHQDNLYLSCKFPLAGSYQSKNLITALETIRILQNQGLTILMQHIQSGIENVVKNTTFKGRWQTLAEHPKIICDSGHNYDGILKIVENINATDYEKLHVVLGVVNDKHLDGILSLLPKKATYYFCKANIPRGLPAENLHKAARQFDLFGDNYASVSLALDAAKQSANPKDLIFVGGSIFVLAEVLE
jgi:dihydrofolate synthase/folylpolyglutamate synthase